MRHVLKPALGLVIALLVSTSLANAEYPKPPLEAYGSLPQVSSAELSPDGAVLAAIVNYPDATRIVISEIGVGVKRQIDIQDVKARSVRFYDNNYLILRASETTHTPGFIGDYEYSGAFAIDLDSAESTQLMVGTRGLFPAQSGLGRIVGRGKKPGEVLMPAFIGAPNIDPALNLFTNKLGESRGTRYARGTQDTIDWFVGDGGRVLARELYNNEKNRYRVQWRVGDDWQDIYDETTDVPETSIVGVTRDETGLVFTRYVDNGEALMRLGSDGETTGPIIADRAREIDAIYTDTNRKVVGVRYAGVSPDYAFLDADLQDGFDRIVDKLPTATIYLDSWSDDRNRILYRVFEPSFGDLWMVQTRDTDTLSVVGDARPGIPSLAMGSLMSVEYKARDGLTIQAILTLPPDYQQDPSDPRPALVLPHGGPATYDRFGFDWMAQYFANRGYIVVQPNFRGSTGFGRDFELAGRGEWGAKMQDDITDGVKALASSGMIDADQVCIAGASYGGYAALAGAVFTPDLYKCVIAIAPVTDLNMMLSDERRLVGRDHWVVSYWEDVLANGDAGRDKLRNISPANFAENVVAPVLLLHGNDDTVVPYQQSVKMRNRLRQAGKQVDLIKLNGEDHWLSSRETRLQTLVEMDRFVAEHLPIVD